MDDPFDLGRFVDAQAGAYDRALGEIRAGAKRSHWMWFVFPQLRGLGSSPMAQRFGLASLDEARAYLAHPVLGPRLKEITAAALPHAPLGATRLFGPPDDAKFRSSMTLFALADPGEPIFQKALDAFFEGERDPLTLEKLA